MAGVLPIRAKARIRLSISEGFRTNYREFGSLGEAGCLPIHDAAGSKMPTGWKDRLIPGMMIFRSSSKNGLFGSGHDIL